MLGKKEKRGSVLRGARAFLTEIETGHQDDRDYDSARFSLLLFWGRNAPEFLECTALDHCQNTRDTFLRRIMGQVCLHRMPLNSKIVRY
mgnify:CR=1 FL=1